MPVVDKTLRKYSDTDNQFSNTKKHKSFDYRWAIVIGIIIVALVVSIILNNNSNDNSPTKTTGLINVDNGDEKINWNRYTPKDIDLSESLTITNSGIYHLTGSISDGMVTVDAGVKGEVKIILDSVNIANASGPAINCISGDDLVIDLIGSNVLEDGDSYTDSLSEDINAVIYSKADLAFTGDGSLRITANYQDAIVGKDDVKISSGSYTITSVDDAIRGKDSVYIMGGNLNITSGQDAIKSTNNTDPDKGFVLIDGGDITISAGDDAIHGENTIVIQSGIINITKSYEGLESPIIIVNGGKIAVLSSDDGINAGNSADSVSLSEKKSETDESCEVIINDGSVYINSSGDGIDSNGRIYFNGGTVVVDGPTSNNNGALDSDVGITMNGGVMVAIGSSGMVEAPGPDSSIFSVSIYFNASLSAGTKLEIKDSANNTISNHISAKSFSNAVIGSEDFILGNTYSIYLNDEKQQEFTISDVLTTIGNSRTNTNIMPPKDHR